MKPAVTFVSMLVWNFVIFMTYLCVCTLGQTVQIVFFRRELEPILVELQNKISSIIGKLRFASYKLITNEKF